MVGACTYSDSTPTPNACQITQGDVSPEQRKNCLNRLTLERRQVWIYLSAILGGLLVGSTWANTSRFFEMLLWPTLILLLYTTFLQVPLLHLRDAIRDGRFVITVLVGNFIVLPVVAWLLVQWLPADPALRLGVLLVLLVPCTDWFITFSQLGHGNVPRAIAVTPINLLLQLLLLPFYLWLMLGSDLSAALAPADIWPAWVVVLAPLAAAALSERWIDARAEREVFRNSLVVSAITCAGSLSDRGCSGGRSAGCAEVASVDCAFIRGLPAVGRTDRQRVSQAHGAARRSKPHSCLQFGHTQLLCGATLCSVAAGWLGSDCRCDRSAIVS